MTPLSCLTRIRDGHRQAAEAWRECAGLYLLAPSDYAERLQGSVIRNDAAVCDALADKAQSGIDVLEGKGE